MKDEFIKIFSSELNQVLEVKLKEVPPPVPRNNKLYFPILRGTRPLDSENKNDVYAERTAKDYQIKNSFTGLSLYDELQAHLLGEHQQRALVAEFEMFLSESFFEGQQLSLIPKLKSDVVHLRIGEKEHPIYDLGDGIQTLITFSFPLFLRKEEPCMVFIEEPEAHLHPKWQRFFLDTIKTHFTKHQFFFTTHSNIFISYQEASIYQVHTPKQGAKTEIKFIETEHLEILRDLGYQASDLLQANHLIWVEGPSDMIYLNFFLKCCDASLAQGQDYAFVSYGGTGLKALVKTEKNLEELLAKINPSFSVVMDGDDTPKNKTNRQKKIQDFEHCFGERLWVTEKREIENYIPLDLFKQAIKEVSDLSKEDEIIFDDNDEDFGDRFEYSSKLKIKKQTGYNISFKNDKEKLKTYGFDHERGFEDLLNSGNVERYKSFIKLVESAFKKAIYNESADKIKIAKKLVELWKERKERGEEIILDQELQTNLNKMVERIRRARD